MKEKKLNDRIIQLVIVALGAVALLCVGGVIGLSAAGAESPRALESLSSAAVGALVGILAAPRQHP